MIGFIIFSIICLSILVIKIRDKKENGLSPPILEGRLPLIGHASMMLGGNSIRLWKNFEAFSMQSLKAGGVASIKLGPQLYHIITDPDEALYIANTCVNKHFAYDFAKRWLGNGLITASGSTWKGHRKLLNPAFSLNVLLGFMDVFNCQSRKLVDKLASRARSGSFDISLYLRQMALENICLTAFGISADEDSKLLQSYAHAVEVILSIVAIRFQSFWLHSDLIYSFTQHRRREEKALRVINSMADVIIKKKRASLESNKLPNTTFSGLKCKALLDLLLELSEEDALSDQEIREEIDTTIAAALDSTAWVLTYTLILLGSHVDVQDKVFEELKEVIGNDSRDLNKYDLPKLVYLEAVIKESLRLFTTGPITLRTMDRDIKLKNYTLKTGEHCILSGYGIHRHSCWGPDREMFKPERWFKAETQEFVHAGFSLGRRTCIGKTYAMMTLKTVLSHLLYRYKITANVNDLLLKLDFILKPVSGHFVSIELRT